jgi:mono/diheme cytochrome c family protein
MRFASVLLGILLVAGSASAGEGHGRKVYDRLCSACHGQYGRGEGLVAADLSVKPPDFTKPGLLEGRTDAQVVADLLEAGKTRPHSPMLFAQSVKPETLTEAVAYMRTLAVPGKHVSVLAGQDIYETFCWLCHGLKGNGKGPAADRLPGPKPRDFTAKSFVVEGREAELAKTITSGAASTIHGSKYMEEWGTELTPQQVNDVIAYIATFHPGAK